MKISVNLSTKLSKSIEAADFDAFTSMFYHFPEKYKEEYGFGIEKVGNIDVLISQKIPFRHFNCPQGLGIIEPMSAEQLEEILSVFEKRGIKAFYIHANPFAQPQNFTDLLQEKGMKHLSSWERIWRKNEPLEDWVSLPKNLSVEEVGKETANEWANFIDTTYHMPTGPWLLNLLGKEGFHAYILRNNEKIVASRTMIIKNQQAWLGIDAPVPGIMADNFEDDFFLSQKIVEDGLKWEVKLFATDIEKPAQERNTPAYYYWDKLGFEIAYLRENYGF